MQKSAFLEFQIVDKTQALEKVIARFDEIAKAANISVGDDKIAGGDTAKSVGVNSLLTQKTDSTKKDSTGKIVASTGADSASKKPVGGLFSTNVQGGQMPGQYIVPEKAFAAIQQALALPAMQDAMPPGKVIRWGVDSLANGSARFFAFYVLDSRPIIQGDALTDARPSTDPVEGNVVQFTLNNEGARRFKSETGKHVKDNMAIVLDQRVVTRRCSTARSVATDRSRWAAARCRRRRISRWCCAPARCPFRSRSHSTAPSAPAWARTPSTRAMLALGIAMVLIVGILVGYYRFSGMLAVAALVLYLVYTLAMLAGFHAVLTLPGLAGFVLSIGIAVDANVLIFERIREELAHGKSVRLSIDEGFRHALSAIIDTSAHHDPVGHGALSVRHWTGARICRDTRRRPRGVALHGALRQQDLLPPLAQPLARRPDPEHLRPA